MSNPPVISDPKNAPKQTLTLTMPDGAPIKISRASLILGESSTGKTMGAAALAEYMWHRYRKRLRLVTCEPGGYSSVQTHIDMGLIEVCDIAGQRNFMSKMSRLCRGYWPVYKMKNGKTEMILNDPKSEISQEVIDDIGAEYFDGITSMCGQIMLQVTTASASSVNIPGNPDQSKDGTMNVVTDGDVTYRFAGMGHYGFIQNRVNEYVTYTCALPYDEIWWTALPKITDEEKTKKRIYGPAISGSAAIEEALSWFGRVVHVERVNVGTFTEERPDATGVKAVKTAKEEVWMWLQEHTDPYTGGVYKCKMRPNIVGSSKMPINFKTYYDETAKKVISINRVLELEQEVQALTRQYLLDTLPDLGELKTRSRRPDAMYEASGSLSTDEIASKEGIR